VFRLTPVQGFKGSRVQNQTVAVRLFQMVKTDALRHKRCRAKYAESSSRSSGSRRSKRLAKESVQEFTVRALPLFYEDTRSSGGVVGRVVENDQLLWLDRQKRVCPAAAVRKFDFTCPVGVDHYDSTDLSPMQH
jgi:hypothetical protein